MLWQWAMAARSSMTWYSVTWLCTPQTETKQQCFCITFMNFKNRITIFRANKRTKRSQCIASFYHRLMMAKPTEMLGNEVCLHLHDFPCSLFHVTSKQMDWERLEAQTNRLGKTRSNSLLWIELSFAQYSETKHGGVWKIQTLLKSSETHGIMTLVCPWWEWGIEDMVSNHGTWPKALWGTMQNYVKKRKFIVLNNSV